MALSPNRKAFLEKDAVFGLNWAAIIGMMITALVMGAWILISPSTAGPVHSPNPRLAGVATSIGASMHIGLGVVPRFMRIPSYWLTGAAMVLVLVFY